MRAGIDASSRFAIIRALRVAHRLEGAIDDPRRRRPRRAVGISVWTAAEVADQLGDADAVSWATTTSRTIGWALTGEEVDDHGLERLSRPTPTTATVNASSNSPARCAPAAAPAAPSPPTSRRW